MGVMPKTPPSLVFNESGEKLCTMCKRYRPTECFSKHNQMKHGLNPSCRDCVRNAPHNSSDAMFARNILNNYGLAIDDYNRMSEEQNGRCYICKQLPTAWKINTKNGPIKPKLVVDHCHKTGRVRRLLCQRCNNLVARMESTGTTAETLSLVMRYINEERSA